MLWLNRFHITHIQVWGCNAPFPLYPISFTSGPLDSHLTSIQVVSHPDAGPHICVSPQSMWHLSYIQFPKIASQLYPGLSQSYPKCYTCFTSIPVSQSCINCRSQDFCLNAIHVLSDLWQCPWINIPPPCCISPPSRCWYSHLISIQVAYPLQPALTMCG